MGIASAWRGERRERQESTPPAHKKKAVSQKDQIMRRVLAATSDDDDDIRKAAVQFSDGLTKKAVVTFRREVLAPKVPSGRGVDLSKIVFDELKPSYLVAPYQRGRVVMSLTDGRDVVEADCGARVVVTVNVDCIRLRWYHRLMDWMFRLRS